MYTESGRQITTKLWDETLKELQFADAGNVLESLKSYM